MKKRLKVAVVCVNYNSYDSLKNYLYSLNIAGSKTRDDVSFDVYIADNSTKKETIDIATYEHIKVAMMPLDNLGYLGGVFAVINSWESTQREIYDYVVISNVDVTVNEDFGSQLANYKQEDKLSWIAPAIYNTHLGKVGSAEWTSRPSKRRMKFYSFLYAHPVLYRLYWLVSRIKIRSSHNNISKESDIYAGYGSFMILTKEFVQLQSQWVYPSFLFGEEIFFAEIARYNGMKVKYVPDIMINDIGKVSTGRIGNKRKLQMQKESNDYLYNEFFKEA